MIPSGGSRGVDGADRSRSGHMSVRRLMIAVPALFLLGACGGDDGQPAASGSSSTGGPSSTAASSSTAAAADATPAAGGSADPCSLLTAAEVSAAVGGKVGEGEKSGPDGPLGLATCIWSTAGVPVRTFQIAISTDDGITVDGYTAARLYEDTVTQVKATPASGIGDKAAFAAATGLVLKGDAFMTTSVGFGTSDTAKAALRTLTTKAATNL